MVTRLFYPLFSILTTGPNFGEYYKHPHFDRGTLKKGHLNIQDMIDQAEDGTTIYIPLGRYIFKEGLFIQNRKNIILDFAPGTEILVENTSAHVLSIIASTNITIQNASMRHLSPLRQYNCHGAVVYLKDASDISIINSQLHGSGAIGVSAWQSQKLLIERCLIRHNSFNAFYFDGCSNIRIHHCTIRNNGNMIQMYRSDDLEMQWNQIAHNGGYWDTLQTE